uniref:Cytochrome c biogenesis protein CcsA n=1 Tax=Cyanophora paradoxa TaxID=2762 RepID=CCSA_CYAPA|nr:cytochrome c biogenesis protein [Cyanophora paradoxa]P48257.1 RecName: Full=Cytochrome c biogenesis protein CcsA [Cyanophora paradoxa]AAA81298.1 ycf5 [Cyanophora paradoxa]
MNISTLQLILETFSFFIYFILTFLFFAQAIFKNHWLKTFNFSGMLIANVSIFLLLITRWITAGYFPISNLYESLFFLVWGLNTIWLFLYKNNMRIQLLDNSVSLLLTLLVGFLHFILPQEMREISPLVPALKSNWLMMHVSVMMISYATLMIGSLLSIIYLYFLYRVDKLLNKINAVNLMTSNQNSNSLIYNLSFNTLLNSSKSMEYQILLKDLSLIKLSKRLDNLSYRLITFGFPLLTIGIIAGAVWANEAWGSYWSWDPKETWALITWLIFAIYLHTRIIKGWQGKKAAMVASLGFFIIWICYLGVNLLGKGIHSYGWFF